MKCIISKWGVHHCSHSYLIFLWFLKIKEWEFQNKLSIAYAHFSMLKKAKVFLIITATICIYVKYIKYLGIPICYKYNIITEQFWLWWLDFKCCFYFISIFYFFFSSILDQKHKQTLTFNGSSAIGNFDGKLLVASTSSVYGLKPVSIQIQIEVS